MCGLFLRKQLDHTKCKGMSNEVRQFMTQLEKKKLKEMSTTRCIALDDELQQTQDDLV
jgi:hypothetical protein